MGKRLKRTEIVGNQIEESEVEGEKFEYDSNVEMIQPIVKIKRLKQTEINQIEEPKTGKVVKIKKLKRTEVDDNQLEVDDNQIVVDDNQIEESQVEDNDKFEYIITKRLKKVVKTKHNQVEESQ